MEITDITAMTVEIPLVGADAPLGIAPYVMNHREISSVRRVLVRVDTSDGRSGWGEMRPFLAAGATESLIEDGVAQQVIGQSPFDLEQIRRRVTIEYTNVEMFFAAVETACWDIVGQALGRPVYELLGGRNTPSQTDSSLSSTDRSVEFAFCLGICSLEQSREKAIAAQEAGFTTLKTKAGRDWRADVDRIIAMDAATNGQIEFRLDPNQGWRPDQALRVASALEDAGIYLQYLEQPIRTDMHDVLASLRYRTKQPIAPNEDTYVPHNLQSLIEHNALDVAVLDLTPAGGLSGLRQQVALTEAAGIPAVHHCGFDLGIRTAAICHAVYGMAGFALPSDTTYYSWADTILDQPFEFDNGCLTVPSEPGLGISVDMDAVNRRLV
ncbi:mandelate racemase/muconate lactonizing enzyme family protein [Halocatena halophila]|uniref:mandelate racemase/muconate lactonizing enzyme family protein n=1 Tax=Halocatena halophila TaxID=2814576 RepID=UPI002ECFCB22